MKGYQDTFKRMEKKYLLSEGQYSELSHRLEGLVTPDFHN